jgi:hypothetical protein
MQWIMRAGAARHGDAKMSELYVLMEAGWDYNDEIQFRPDGGGGHPKKVFSSKDKAQKECDNLNVKEFKKLFATGEIVEYFYNWDELLHWQKRKDTEYRNQVDATCTKVFGMDFDALSNSFEHRSYDDRKNNPGLKTATDKDWLAFMNCTKLNFWEVVTVEKG